LAIGKRDLATGHLLSKTYDRFISGDTSRITLFFAREGWWRPAVENEPVN